MCACCCPLWCPLSCKRGCTESQHAGLSQRALSYLAQWCAYRDGGRGGGGQTCAPTAHTCDVSRATRACAAHYVLCRTRVTTCGCVSAGVHCGVLICVRGVARSLHTLGFPSAPSLRERLRQPPRPHTTDSPLPHPLCATSQDPEPLALFLLVTTTQLRLATGCVSPSAWSPARTFRSAFASQRGLVTLPLRAT